MSLPVEIILEIAATPETFAQLLALPPFARYVRENREHALSKFTSVVKNDRYTRYYLWGKIHRYDGPAVECAGGHKEWWLYGKLHREDGPAIEFVNGRKEWWQHGKYLYLRDPKYITLNFHDQKFW